MSRLWFGCLLLLVLLGFGFFISFSTCNTHEEISALLSNAAQAAETGEWDRAEALFSQAAQRWQKLRPWTAAITDHGPMEEIDHYFAQADRYLQFRSPLHFSASCQGLSVLTEAIGDAQAVNWWSLL